MQPLFLTLDEVIRIHRDQVERYGGSAGVRDVGLLESAVAAPKASFGGHRRHANLFEMAAAYLFHIVGNHAFIDGNKRTGAAAAAAIVFLILNGVKLEPDEDGLEAITMAVAKGEASKRDVAAFFRRIGRP
ncbi:MAG: type II toxin-antitoxin system death-on-curing family toxin [Phycisphaerae bacterium]|nr:type II toxin-antitoxin system death-on-curing family toxin [Phycisphaerae bacterium]